jgi:hypothetical protein
MPMIIAQLSLSPTCTLLTVGEKTSMGVKERKIAFDNLQYQKLLCLMGGL